MRRLVDFFCLVVFVAGISPAVRAQGPPPPPPPPPPPGQGRDAGPQKTGTSKLSGRVTSLDTGRPIRRAQVRANSPELREGKSVSTDAEGRWSLRELPAGRYSLTITKGGYVSLSYGQRRPFETGKTVEVGEGQSVDKLDVALPRGSAITGRVIDEFGDAVTGARVSAMRFRFVGGQRRLVSAGASDATDDLGQYRLYGLPPGDYYVVVQQTTAFMLGTSEDRTGYAQTYYPGALSTAEATRVPLAVGQEAQNIVVALAPTRTANLSGTASTSNGKPIPQAIGFMRESSPMGSFTSAPIVIRDGKWTVTGVIPGDYVISVQFMGNVEVLAVSGGVGDAATSSEFIVHPITVTGDDMTNIALVAGPGGTLKGRVKFEGASSPPPVPTGAFAMASELSVFGTSGAGRIRPDWTFDITGLYGKRLVRISEVPSGWTLASVTLNGEDVTDTGIDVSSGSEVAGLEVTLTQQAGELSGTVTNAKNVATNDFVVVLFPPEADRWGPASRFVRSVRPDQTGRFKISGVLAGSYLAVALEYLEPGEETNPEFLEKLKSIATAVRVAEGEKKTLTLKLASQ